MMVALLLLVATPAIQVSSTAELKTAAARAKPGQTILLSPGTYAGDLYLERINGERGAPIIIRGADPNRPPTFQNGSTGIHLSRCSYITLKDIGIRKMKMNGINVDDGGQRTKPVQGIQIENVWVSELPAGNHDAFKLSGVKDFSIRNCTATHWGGSAIDLVGCHQGTIANCRLENGGDNGVQIKGGSTSVTVEACTFVSAGQRGVNVGGSTGVDFFRPPVDSIQPNAEARHIRVQGCTFVRGVSAIAFVGVDKATVSYNTIVNPQRWAFRILQETRLPGFVPTRNVTISDNLIAFNPDQWREGGINVGEGTEPATFRFNRNFWFGREAKVHTMAADKASIFGIDPHISYAANGTVGVREGSPAEGFGAHAFRAAKR